MSLRPAVSPTTGARIVLLVLLVAVTACTGNPDRPVPPRAVNGVLDLRGWETGANGTVRLDGEWEFYWEELVPPRRFQAAPAEMHRLRRLIDLPGHWNGTVVDGETIGSAGYATYRLTIVTGDNAPRALKILDSASACSIWANGELVFQSGTVGTSRETMRPAYRTGTTIVQPVDGAIDLVMQISNFVHRRGGAWSPMRIGTPSQIATARELAIMHEFVLFGALLIIGVYHIGLFLLRRNDRSALFFGLFCILVALRVVVTGERALHTYLPGLGWNVLLRIEYLSWYVAAPLFMVFLRRIFTEVGRTMMHLCVAISGAFVAAVVVLPPMAFSQTLPAFQLFVSLFAVYVVAAVILATLHRQESAALVAVGSVILIGTLVHDMMLANGWIYGINLAPLGSITFVFVQAYMISRRYARAFALNEDFSAQLEERVRLRTRKLVEANREIRRSKTRLEETQAQLIQAQKMEALGTMAGGIAHEFNNLLGTILAFTEILLERQEPESPDREFLDVLYTTGVRATELVQQILVYSRGDDSALSVQPIQATVAETIELVRVTLPESIELVSHIDPAPGPIAANLTQVSQIVVNLVANAVHAMRESGGRIDVEVRETTSGGGDDAGMQSRWLLLRVTDDGPGIPESVRDRIFDPFFTTKPVGQGTGLGLSIVHGIVTGHNGWISVESESGRGTTVSVLFPAASQTPPP